MFYLSEIPFFFSFSFFSLLGLVCKDKRRRGKIKVTTAKDGKLKTKWGRRGSQAKSGAETLQKQGKKVACVQICGIQGMSSSKCDLRQSLFMLRFRCKLERKSFDNLNSEFHACLLH